MLGVSVCFSEFLSDGFSESFSAFLGLETFVFDFGEVELIDDESGGHDVVLVDVSDEGLDSCSLDEFLLVIASFGLEEVATDACNEQMGEPIFLHVGGCTLFPVSKDLTTMAFFPANLPWVRTTTLPVLKLYRGGGTFCPLVMSD